MSPCVCKEACKITISRKLLFLQISLAILLPLSALYLNEIHITRSIHAKNQHTNNHGRHIAWLLIQSIYTAVLICFSLYSTSAVVYIMACFYTSKAITFKNVSSAFLKVWGRLIVTFFWYFLIIFIYLGLAIGLLIFFSSTTGEGRNILAIILLILLIPFVIGYLHITIVWNIATVACVLEDHYGRKALRRGMKLIKGKLCVSFGLFLMLEFGCAGILVVYGLVVGNGNKLSLVGKIFVGIGCYLGMVILLHFHLVTQTVIYFVCKSHHNENILDVAEHLEHSYLHLAGGTDNVADSRIPI